MDAEINAEFISKFKPCKDGFDNFRLNYPTFSGSLTEFFKLIEVTYEEKLWLGVKILTPRQRLDLILLYTKTTKDLEGIESKLITYYINKLHKFAFDPKEVSVAEIGSDLYTVLALSEVDSLYYSKYQERLKATDEIREKKLILMLIEIVSDIK